MIFNRTTQQIELPSPDSSPSDPNTELVSYTSEEKSTKNFDPLSI